MRGIAVGSGRVIVAVTARVEGERGPCKVLQRSFVHHRHDLENDFLILFTEALFCLLRLPIRALWDYCASQILDGRGDYGVKAKYWKAKPRVKFNSDLLREINKNHREGGQVKQTGRIYFVSRLFVLSINTHTHSFTNSLQ